MSYSNLTDLTRYPLDTNTVANVACVASVEWGCAVQVESHFCLK